MNSKDNYLEIRPGYAAGYPTFLSRLERVRRRRACACSLTLSTCTCTAGTGNRVRWPASGTIYHRANCS